MPTEYVKKLAEEHDMSIEAAEKKWDEAKKLAKEEGTSKDYYAYVTSIFKSMMHEPKGHGAGEHKSKGHETKSHAAKDSGHKKSK